MKNISMHASILLALVVVCDEMVDAPLQPVFERLRSGFVGFQHSRSLFDPSVVNDNGEVIDLAAADAVQLRLGQRKPILVELVEQMRGLRELIAILQRSDKVVNTSRCLCAAVKPVPLLSSPPIMCARRRRPCGSVSEPRDGRARSPIVRSRRRRGAATFQPAVGVPASSCTTTQVHASAQQPRPRPLRFLSRNAVGWRQLLHSGCQTGCEIGKIA